jgi:hypothetical protein
MLWTGKTTTTTTTTTIIIIIGISVIYIVSFLQKNFTSIFLSYFDTLIQFPALQ